ncbi:hypothetical protein QVD17_37399 [Tagetes erecta]|uniref:Uncharacterized protein n=1 Tax=Tagetes erecta TaxID=13708 RepID=A0AAD8JVX6_TARER|nr:hypothetical protein QVD17_37399 [Tagetes erecta]
MQCRRHKAENSSNLFLFLRAISASFSLHNIKPISFQSVSQSVIVEASILFSYLSTYKRDFITVYYVSYTLHFSLYFLLFIRFAPFLSHALKHSHTPLLYSPIQSPFDRLFQTLRIGV